MEQRIESERERISAELLRMLNEGLGETEQYKQLYAAQQALAWADNPDAARSPYDMIMLGPVGPLEASIPPTDTPAGSGDYSVPANQPAS